MTKIFAHRGASGYAPENTMPAFELARQQEADGIELDVQPVSYTHLTEGSHRKRHYTEAEGLPDG